MNICIFYIVNKYFIAEKIGRIFLDYVENFVKAQLFFFGVEYRCEAKKWKSARKEEGIIFGFLASYVWSTLQQVASR